MELSFHLLFALVSLALFNVSTKKLKPKGRIISGDAAEPGQFPFYVLIKKHAHHLAGGGGSLISRDWVLTAAHVITESEQVILVFGVTKLNDKNPLSMTSTLLYQHPGYKADTMVYDIALIRLPHSVPLTLFIQPVALPSFSDANNSYVNAEIFVSGFGYTNDAYQRKVPNELQFTTLDIIDNKECGKFLRKEMPEVIVCAKSSMNSATCKGDSGGPAVVIDFHQNGFVQVGIISFGYDLRCTLPKPVGLARVTEFLDWINDATGLIEM